jgi:hypothetical protein
MVLSKRDEAFNAKHAQRMNLQRQREIFMQNQKENRMKTQMIKEQERIGLLKKQQFEMQKMERAKKELDNKVAEEERVRN